MLKFFPKILTLNKIQNGYKKENFKPEITPMIENLQDENFQLENKQPKRAKIGANIAQRWRNKNAQKLSSKCLVHGIGAKPTSICEQNILYDES